MPCTNDAVKIRQDSRTSSSIWSSPRLTFRSSTVPTTRSSFTTSGPGRRVNTIIHSKGATPGYIQQRVKGYNLKWPTLREWLIRHFVDHPELEASLLHTQGCVQDNYYFWIPSVLNETDFHEIDALRVKNTAVTNRDIHRPYTPDHNPDDSGDDA
ncbi:uncharacterized protein JN550_004250 [Neoarthrinium moseri]|uniref:uncharacterized protein n=1 Tax=Neoarthrinium moseri TaxID=1658444 RepID=UPI001FDC0083|nr:uncharacterized protein JN550_004250 [Neoarthrinium moseri]KAI1872047.1 hypothetical protein JN550_004250 [Neoarthrinium moseri]